MTEKTKFADIIIYSNAIYTVSEEEMLAGGIAISGNEILAVGPKEEINEFKNETTVVYDMHDKLVLPGFIEGHTHIDGPLIRANRVNLVGVTSKEECVRLTKEWAEERPDEEWIFGFGWHLSNWDDRSYPTKTPLDEAISDRPVVLQDLGCHGSWMNSKALEKLGIGKDPIDLLETFDYEGVVFRDENGEPTGFIQDGPLMYLMDQSNEYINENPEKHLAESARLHAEKGITSINEMWLHHDDSEYIKGLKALEEKGNLKMRVFFQYDLMNNTIEEAVNAKARFVSDKLKLIGLKAIADSVWADRSGALIRPYADDLDNYGELYLEPETWGEKIAAGNKAGLTVHLHCSGNRAVRAALDVYEMSIKENGGKKFRNTIEHCDTVHPNDIPRFAELGVLANVTPDFMSKTVRWEDNPLHYIYDEETKKWAWPFNSLIKSGAVVTYGTDSPASEFDPFIQIYRGATRVSDDGGPDGGFLPEEKVSVKDAIKSYTYNSAYQAGMEDKLGTLEKGKLADIIVLDKNILEIPVEKLRDTNVILTIADGEIVFQR